jgi:cell division protein FtsB
LCILAVVLVIDALFGDKGLFKTIRIRRQYQDLDASIARLRSENARMRDEARRLREDPGAVEEVARRELGLIKPGEMVFIVKDARPRADLDGGQTPRSRK